jgi:hypothetical protein
MGKYVEIHYIYNKLYTTASAAATATTTSADDDEYKNAVIQ